NDAYAAALGTSPVPAGTTVLAGCSLGTTNTTSCPTANWDFTAFGKDVVTTPMAGACVACHDASATKAHMQQNGAWVDVVRTTGKTFAESCAVCHGAGAQWDVSTVHK
ncbi:MAG: hypothetical protein H6Q33_5427, partial [Deltaproteobacteria bacterium]|nr:hypothetical protein [Deltaproteobacteria bacterium]